MPEIEHYEILVIGSGEAGKQVTWNMAQAGHRTAVVAGRVRTSRACRARTRFAARKRIGSRGMVRSTASRAHPYPRI